MPSLFLYKYFLDFVNFEKKTTVLFFDKISHLKTYKQ